MSDKKNAATSMAEIALGMSLGPWVAERVVGLFKRADEELEGKNEEQIGLQLRHEQAKSEMLQAQAKAAFEFALANRIMSAREVEVEEFFEGSGAGGLGVNLEEKTLGAHGRGVKVTRRVVRLQGWPEAASAEVAVLASGRASGEGPGSAAG
ncbi:hypothetical protein [Sorangium sp. So ce542]|uniref:hypothetical protein n=1 Tax=Sorangium sp. So ce542 TaxID=3133316 RepID=UPI003F61BC5A